MSTIFERLLEQDGWSEGHAPEGLLAEKIKYKIGDEPEWHAFYKAIPQERVDIIHQRCILEFEHDPHTFPLEAKVPGRLIKQRCPGVQPWRILSPEIEI